MGSISEILQRKKLNKRVFYCDGKCEDRSLISIQTISRLYSLPPPYPIYEPVIDSPSIENNSISTNNTIASSLHTPEHDNNNDTPPSKNEFTSTINGKSVCFLSQNVHPLEVNLEDCI